MAKFDDTVTFHRSQDSGPHRAIVFLHGGAWIDATNTPHDFDKLAEHLVRLNQSEPEFSLYAVEYRLSPEVKHPAHLLDVIDNLAQLIRKEQVDELNLFGHSVGATLVWQLLTCSPALSSDLETIRSKVNRCYLADGIFSLVDMLKEYPTYDYFVSQAFTKVKDYDDPEDLTLQISSNIKLHILHSYEDELLSLRQSNYLCKVLQAHQQPYQTYYDVLGKHNDVYESLKVAEYIMYTMMY
ncbi:LAME_0G13982g1_1 [Lachancea meyersii CBS 8951]|uniref:LAME_0G13982g1_1 n=1 Tax=Lachancea meyersii CBS 8951 TaxID=1266667 RepID=A0A1G4KA76_9SACH|nr:LAME_0G13982g1_1 [Lachancea meyersii CBS 8951]